MTRYPTPRLIRARFMCGMLLVSTIILSAILATPTASAATAPTKDTLGETLEPTVRVEAILEQKSETPTLDKIRPYTEALGIYQYKVTKVVKGDRQERTILVAHWVIWRNLTQPITEQLPGTKATLDLIPFADVKGKVQTVYTSDSIGAVTLPVYYHVAQELTLPASEQTRWGYGVDLAEMMPVFFRLKDQLKLVALGDCQAWFANKASIYYGAENQKAPVALNMCQQRSGLPFQKMFIEDYLVHLPKLEWIVLTWHTRWVNVRWREHGIKARQFSQSSGYLYDQTHAPELWNTSTNHPLITVAAIESDPDLLRVWSQRPWGHISQIDLRENGSETVPEINGLRGQRHGKLAEERWRLFEQIATTCADHKIKLLVYTTPVAPVSAMMPCKDKSGTSAEMYQEQVRRMHQLETLYPDTFFFYDLNNMGDNGLVATDFVNVDHVSGSGARKVTERVEAFRQKIEQKLANKAATGK